MDYDRFAIKLHELPTKNREEAAAQLRTLCARYGEHALLIGAALHNVSGAVCNLAAGAHEAGTLPDIDRHVMTVNDAVNDLMAMACRSHRIETAAAVACAEALDELGAIIAADLDRPHGDRAAADLEARVALARAAGA